MKLILFNGVDSSGGAAFASSPAIVAGDKFTQIYNLTTGGDAYSQFMPACPSDGIIVQWNGVDLTAYKFLGVVLP